MKQVIGIDVAKEKIDCLWLRDTNTLKIKTKVLPNNPAGFKQLIAWCQKHVTKEVDNIHVCMEATGVYHEALAYALFEQGFQVSVVNPAWIRDFAKGLGTRHKTDKKDSMILARYAAMANPALWQPEPVEVRELKALLARLAAIETDIRRELNRLEKAQVSQSSNVVIGSIEDMSGTLSDEKRRLQALIDNHIDKHPQLKQDHQLLQSIPAVGDVLSREMLSLLNSRDFKKASQVAAFVGVVPRLQESGSYQGKTMLCKQGHARLRAILYMAAIVAKQYNPDIKAQYERLLRRGKTKMQALGAAMRKLVQICFGVIKHQCEYRPQVAI